jgi:DnaJ domain
MLLRSFSRESGLAGSAVVIHRRVASSSTNLLPPAVGLTNVPVAPSRKLSSCGCHIATRVRGGSDCRQPSVGANLFAEPSPSSRASCRRLSPPSFDVAKRALHTSSAAFQRGGSTQRKDLYEILGVSKDASKDDIKKSYYKLAKKYHPDTNKDDPNAASKFADVQNAYEVLSDENKRRAYDLHGHAGVDPSAAAEEGGPGGMGGEPFASAEELFERFFAGMGGGPGGRGGRRG